MVLTVQTTKVAACAGYRQTCRARMEVVLRLLLDGVDGQRTRPSIHLTDEYTVLIASATADARPALADTTMMWAEQTLHPPVIQFLIIPALHHVQCSTFNG